MPTVQLECADRARRGRGRTRTARTRSRPGAVALAGVALLASGAALAAVVRDHAARARLGTARRWGLGIASAAVAVVLARYQLARAFTSTPPYLRERRLGRIEIRRYPSRVIAETAVRGDTWEDALNLGFRRLAGYIFGANERRADSRLARLAQGRGEKLAMTTPVTSTLGHAAHIVAFGMPPGRALASLPAPRDARIVLRALPAQRIAVLRTKGRYRARALRNKEAELARLCRDAGLTPTGEAIFAGYDPPWTLPFLRRVEIWLPLAQDPPESGVRRTSA